MGPDTPDGAMPLDATFALKPSEAWPWKSGSRRYEGEAFAALVVSLREHGVLTPIEVDQEAGYVERGHHRVVAARVAGLKEVPCPRPAGGALGWCPQDR